jgi:hypothetical protein
MQSFLTLDLAHLQQAERLAVANQPGPAPVDRATRPRTWPSSNRPAGLGLTTTATLLLQAVLAICGVVPR